MSLKEIVHPIFRIFNSPAAEQLVIAPEIGAVIAVDDFAGTYAETFTDSFGEQWFVIASAFEQRTVHASQFVWRYCWNGEVA